MKKTKKRVLGLLGLILVAITTIFAAFLPTPEASATDTTTVTDTITVRVVGDTPDVAITSPIVESGERLIFVIPDQDLSFIWSNTEYVAITVHYTNKDGETRDTQIYSLHDPKYQPGDLTYLIDFLGSEYGYGEYRVDIEGVGFGGVTDEDSVEFSFYPVYGETFEGEENGLIYLDLHYDTESENIETIKVNIYDENGNLVSEMSPITVQSPNTEVELPFAENNMPTGNYRIEIVAYDEDGEVLYLPYYTNAYYKAIPVPDTGAPSIILNISKTDYLVTGLIIFLLLAIFGIIFVAKGRSNKKAPAKRRCK